ncbi:hypothetical protein AWRI1631_160110 [Saccharomyces cerevisiae AWRI1631]|uniref:Uncharacterized protein n=1 Tax=Saccharomyces cerevisiae (strain AWRI1631) TaxID=545124 RepID=B5VSS3_YEAS6|nr:hypothetical protein AWRI1631_160110 [Saccharomyces cerevisiae AWRI1631]
MLFSGMSCSFTTGQTYGRGAVWQLSLALLYGSLI